MLSRFDAAPLHPSEAKDAFVKTNIEFSVREFCPACHSSHAKHYDRLHHLGYDLSFDQCTICRHVFMNPVPSQAEYNRFYAEDFWEGKTARADEADAGRNEKMWRKQLLWADKLDDALTRFGAPLPDEPHILELGCAYGLIVDTLARRRNGVAYGVEPSHAARSFARDVVGIQTPVETMQALGQWEPHRPLDLMVFSHVMENLVDLDDAFATIRRLLGPGGLVLMDTPNLLYQPGISFYHPHVFCGASLRTLYRRHGFKILGMTASGRAKSLLLPRYLTILARKLEVLPSFTPSDADHLLLAGTRRRWGHFLRLNLFPSTPLFAWDQQLASRYYRRPAHEARIGELAAAIDQLDCARVHPTATDEG